MASHRRGNKQTSRSSKRKTGDALADDLRPGKRRERYCRKERARWWQEGDSSSWREYLVETVRRGGTLPTEVAWF